jgi:hypothetical protein
MRIFSAPVVWSLLMSCAVAADETADNPVYEHLVTEGIAMDDRAVKLPEPSLSPDADAKTQGQVVHKTAAKKGGYDEFTRKSPVAPFLLEIETAGEAAGGDRMQRVDVWFVAYGKLSDVTDEDLLGQLVGGGSDSEKGESDALTENELKERNLKVESTDERSESYFHIESPLLDKVRIEGIGHGVTTRMSKSVLAASLLDPRFADDRKYPNRWRPIVRDSSGGKKVGDAHPYAGFGGYCQVVELAEPKGALFVECHMAINEPHDWFNGTNLLRSKLPVLMQDNVRTLRRKLAKP